MRASCRLGPVPLRPAPVWFDSNLPGSVTLGTMSDPAFPAPRLIRLFSDHAGTVLWLNDLVDYDESGLSAGLVADLERWEESGAFHRAAADLARRVAVEVGERYEVGFDGLVDGIPGDRMHYPHRASNPGAEAAFDALFDAAKAALPPAEDEGPNSGGWYAYAPLSGEVFDPRKH